jgi:hypothetical protein
MDTSPSTVVRGGMTLAGNLAIAWGLLFAVGGVALGVPAIARNGIVSGQTAFHLFLALLAILLFYAGVGVRRQRRGAPFLALAVSVTLIALAIALPAPLLLASAAVSLAIIVLVLANWQPAT